MALQALRHSEAATETKFCANSGTMQVSFHKENASFPFFRKRNRQIERNGRLSIVRKRARNQKPLELLGIPELIQTQPQKPEPVSRRAERVGVSDNPTPRPTGYGLDRYSVKVEAAADLGIARYWKI
jgi:hypothetical protein